MPVATAAKVEALSVDFRSQAALAEILGVSRSRVTRWLKGAGIDPLNAEKVDLLELVWSNLLAASTSPRPRARGSGASTRCSATVGRSTSSGRGGRRS